MNITSYIITVLSNGTQLYTETVDRFTVEHGIGYSFTPETLYKVRLHARSEAGLGDEETVFVTTYKYCEYLILNSVSFSKNTISTERKTSVNPAIIGQEIDKSDKHFNDLIWTVRYTVHSP